MTITKRIAKGSPLTYAQLDANFDELISGLNQKANLDLSNVTTLPPAMVAQLQGDKGDKGDKGNTGDKGDTGHAGLSAYELALSQGYSGTLSEWLSSLGSSSSDTSTTQAGSALFSGAQYLTITDNKITFAANEDFTIEAFVYRTANTTSYDGIFSLCGGGTGWNSGGNGFVLCAGNFHISPNGSTNYSSSIALNAWTHIATSRKAGVIRIFINGSQVASVSNADALGTGTGVPMIGMFDSGRYGFTGNITNLRVVKGIALYDTPFTPPNAPLGLVSGTKLLMRMSAQETMTKDYSPQNSSITNSGATFSPLDPFGL